MMEYKVEEMAVYNSEGFEDSVTSSMHEGWKPKGGVSVCNDFNGHPTFYQAMIRNVPLPPVPPQRSSAVVGSSSSDSGGGFSRKKSKRRLRKTQQRSKRNNQKSRKL
jgi:hypothetical protein